MHYNIDTIYFIESEAMFNGKVYKSKKDNNSGHIPVGDLKDSWWEEA